MMAETNNGETPQLPPWLVLSHGMQNEKQTFYSLSEKRFHTSSIPELANKCILASAFGWLVLVDYDTDECCLWNPSSMEIIGLDLPDWGCSPTYNKCVLSKPPTDPDCHILFFCDCQRHLALCRLVEGELIGRSLEDEDEEIFLCAAASFHGKIYGYTTTYSKPSFVSIHFTDKTIELTPVFVWETDLFPIWGGPPRCYLIESACASELLLVVERMWCSRLCDDGVLFRVFRVDINGKTFLEMEDIGNQAIFLNEVGGIDGKGGEDGVCCSTTSSNGVKPNSIYYTVLNSKNLYICDLDDNSQTVLLPCPVGKRSQVKHKWVDRHVLSIDQGL